MKNLKILCKRRSKPLGEFARYFMTDCEKNFLFIGVELIYKVVLVSGVQQSESVIHIYILIFFRFFPHLGHYRILSIVPVLYYCILVYVPC